MTPFRLKIVTPDGEYFNGDVFQVSLRSIDGDVSILANHMPYVTAIGTGECRIYDKESGQPKSAACIGGILSVTKAYTSIAATTFEWADEIDLERAKRAKTRAEEAIISSTDRHNSDLAEIRLKRATIRINVAGKKD